MTTLDPNGRESVKRALKTVAAALLGPYRFNRIYRLTSMPVEPTMPPGISCQRLEAPSAAAADIDPELRKRFSYDNDDAYGYGLSRDGCLAAVCWFWGPRRFNEPLIWVLRTNEAILVDLVTASRCRGQGLAPLLIRYAFAERRRRGWRLVSGFRKGWMDADCLGARNPAPRDGPNIPPLLAKLSQPQPREPS